MEQQIKISVANQVSAIRTLGRIVESPTFSVACCNCTEEQKVLIQTYVREVKCRELKNLVQEILKGDFLSIRDLRHTASKMQIKNWSRMTKDALLSAIRIKENEDEQRKSC